MTDRTAPGCDEPTAGAAGAARHAMPPAGSRAELIDLVRVNCVDHQVARPMTAWTRCGPGVEPKRADVLGWIRGSQLHLPRLSDIVALRVADALQANRSERPARISELVDTRGLLELFSRDYLVLRCSWGWYAAGSGELGELIPVRDVSFWRALSGGPADDDFALDAATFQERFAGVTITL